MVSSITSLTGNGLKDWFLQRLSALYLGGYGVFLFVYFLTAHVNADKWLRLTGSLSFKIATIFAVLAYVIHAWIGLWTVITDYIKCICIRSTVLVLLAAWLLGQVVWVLLLLGRN